MKNNTYKNRIKSIGILYIIFGITLITSSLASQQNKIESVPPPENSNKNTIIQKAEKPKNKPIKKSFNEPKNRTNNTASHSPTFDGSILDSPTDYTSKYGEPQKTIHGHTIPGLPANYLIMDYGGLTYNLMIDYITGNTNILWHTPFHLAFYYTKPYYVNNPDGTVSIYPPTFSIIKTSIFVLILIIIGFAIYLIRKKQSKYATLKRQA